MNTLQNNKLPKRMYKSLVFSILLSAFACCFTNIPEANAQSYWGEAAKKAAARAAKEAEERKAQEEKKQRELEAQRLEAESKELEGKYKDEINKAKQLAANSKVLPVCLTENIEVQRYFYLGNKSKWVQKGYFSQGDWYEIDNYFSCVIDANIASDLLLQMEKKKGSTNIEYVIDNAIANAVRRNMPIALINSMIKSYGDINRPCKVFCVNALSIINRAHSRFT